ncbi:MAG: lysoplasmalogenase [Oscillospiraceae bacterium]|jgi:hypothetical protein|nr:lysoplasmalogenase [Oscillospiraceae bacterium]
MTLEIIASCVCVAAMAVLVPLFLKAAWPEKTNKSLLLKMICATLFVLIALLQMRIADNYSDFAVKMLWGFAFSWLGDFFMHMRLKPKAVWYALGVASFLGGHVMFVSAYALAAQKLLGASFWNPAEIAVIAVLFIAAVFILFRMSKNHSNKLLPMLMVYAAAVLTMMVKAVSLGVRLFADGQQPWYAALLLIAGGICFPLSDVLLLLIDFGGTPHHPDRFKTFKVKSVNIWTYFAAQCLLAFTVLFIYA